MFSSEMIPLPCLVLPWLRVWSWSLRGSIGGGVGFPLNVDPKTWGNSEMIVESVKSRLKIVTIAGPDVMFFSIRCHLRK